MADLRAGMDEFAVLVFRDQPFADDEQPAFAQRFDGALHTKTGVSALKHSIAHSRRTLGFEFSSQEAAALEGAIHPLVRTLPRSGRRSLYLASHA